MWQSKKAFCVSWLDGDVGSQVEYFLVFNIFSLSRFKNARRLAVNQY
jgi:hypothetical protein